MRLEAVKKALFSDMLQKDIAAAVGVYRQIIPTWVKRYKDKGFGALLHPNSIT